MEHGGDSPAGSDPAATDETVTIPLNRPGPDDTPRVGPKAANLGVLLRAGFPVPAGFCLTTEAFRAFVAACDAIETLCTGSTTDGDRAIGPRVRERLADLPVPPMIDQAVERAMKDWPPGCPVAVRSSATAEDLHEASGAGQQDTFLNVRGHASIVQAIRSCWISLFTDRAISYRARRKIDPRRVAMAVVVQKMVPAEAAGVIFTADPVTGCPDRIVIEGSFGLGDAVVSGKVSPDRLVLEKTSLNVLERHVSRKGIEVVMADEGGVREQPVDESRRQTASFTDEQARDLARLALEAERLFGCPQDVEWAISAGKVFVLQSRPITTRPAGASSACAPGENPIVWSNVNIGELLPDVATPMTWSVLMLAMTNLFGPLLKRLGIDMEREPLIGLVAGRLYVNLNAFSRFVGGMPVPGQLKLDEAFGGHEGTSPSQPPAVTAYDARAGRLRRLGPLLKLALLGYQLVAQSSVRRGNALVARLREHVDQMTRLDLESKSEENLASLIGPSIRGHLTGIGGLGCAAVGMGCANALYRRCKTWFGDEEGAIANRLISGAGGMDSAEAALDICRLAVWARGYPSLTAALAAPARFADVQRNVLQSKEGQEFLGRWDRFMFRHGHHAVGELDVHNPRWSEMPDYVLDIIRAHLAAPPEADPLMLQERKAGQRARLVAECHSRLSPFRRLLFDFLVRKAQRGLAMRENFKSELIRLLAVLRRVLLDLGDRMARRGVLGDREDIFFLYLEEVEPLRRGEARFDVRATIAERRAEYAFNQTLRPPPVVVGRFDPSQSVAAPIPLEVDVLHGLAVSPGVVTGPARVILRPDASARVLPGEILVAPFTDPGWTPCFLHAAAIVMDMGGMLSHGSIVAREYGVPAVVNVGPATQLIRTGQTVRVDGNRATVTILDGR
jgi:rifampicin phosphotransferase